ncbi:hypothetical protein B0H11DRAFT_2061645 [Mycena galericulata]|nr:hypothetical protein B0H11DRAFT_2061645 [Mycena galericulata]
MPSPFIAQSVLSDGEPSLPPEIEQEIFGWTAIHYPSSIPTLMRVARRVQLWVEPYLFRVIMPPPGPPYSIIENAVLRPTPQSKPASFYRDAVRYVHFVYQSETSPAVLKVLTRTRNVVVTGDWPGPDPAAELIQILLEMDLRRLSLSLEDLFSGREHIDLKHPLFNSITHLHLFDHAASIAAQLSPHISSLPALTHLCLNNSVPDQILHALLSDCPHLHLLVTLWYFLIARTAPRDPPVSDPRFVVGSYKDFEDEWTAGAHGAPDFWTLAEEFVARKRSGAIPESCYWMGDEA